MVTLSDRPAFLDACDHARSVTLSAYVLPQRVADRLARAARHGVAVTVKVAARPFADSPQELHALEAQNRHAVATIERAGGHGMLLPQSKPLHMKAAVLDGSVAYLDDRNWADGGSQTILRDDDPQDVAVVASALDGTAEHNDHLATLKPDSAALESALIDAARAPLAVESESFGFGPVHDALLRAGQRGVAVRLLVADREVQAALVKPSREFKAIRDLEGAGVEVRVASSDEKMAFTDKVGWVGSTNATSTDRLSARQLDWGMRTRDPRILEALRTTFATTWNASTPFERYVGDKAPSVTRAFASARATTSSMPDPKSSASARAVCAT